MFGRYLLSFFYKSEESAQANKQLGFRDRLKKIGFDLELAPEFFIDQINYEVPNNPVMLDKATDHFIDDATVSQHNGKNPFNMQPINVIRHPFTNSIVTYGNGKIKTLEDLSDDDKIAYQNLVLLIDHLESFVSSLEHTYHLRRALEELITNPAPPPDLQAIVNEGDLTGKQLTQQIEDQKKELASQLAKTIRSLKKILEATLKSHETHGHDNKELQKQIETIYQTELNKANKLLLVHQINRAAFICKQKYAFGIVRGFHAALASHYFHYTSPPQQTVLLSFSLFKNNKQSGNKHTVNTSQRPSTSTQRRNSRN